MEASVSSKVAIGFEFLLQEFSLFLFYKSVGLSWLLFTRLYMEHACPPHHSFVLTSASSNPL